MRPWGLLAIPLLLAVASPAATAAEAATAHWSYAVTVRDPGTPAGWRAPTENDRVPDHWEWWSAQGLAVDAHGDAVPSTGYTQAFWRPGADWTDTLTTFVAGASVIRSETTAFAPLPWVRSDVALNVGGSSLNLLTGGGVDSRQTSTVTRFGVGPLPCGYHVERVPEGIRLAGSCDQWPMGDPGASTLARADEPGQGPLEPYEGHHIRAWLEKGSDVPSRLELGDLRLDLVGSSSQAVPLPAVRVPAPTPWTLAPGQPWGLDETGVAGPFTAKAAYQSALTASAGYPLSIFLLQHPGARPYSVNGLRWMAGNTTAQRWDFLVADDQAAWTGNVTRESGDAGERVTATGSLDEDLAALRLPRVAALPPRLPTVASLADRWSAWTGEPASGLDFWSLDVRCGATCDQPDVRFEAGRELWRYPSQEPAQALASGQRVTGTTSRASFGLDGGVLALARSDFETGRPALLTLTDSEDPPSAGDGAGSPRLYGMDPRLVGVVAGAALTAALGAALLRGLPLAVGLYARIRSDRLPEHPTRALILDLVSTAPGIRYSELLAALGCGKGTLEHHLDLLEKSGHLVYVKRNGLATYFRTQKLAAEHGAAWLRSTVARRIVAALAQAPVAAADLHRVAGCSRSTAFYHLARIEAAGLVTRTADRVAITDSGLRAWDDVRSDSSPT